MDKSERTARIAKNLLHSTPHEIRSDERHEVGARSEAAGGVERLATIKAIREVAGRMPADVGPYGLLDEMLALAARNLEACGKAPGAALLRQIYCLDET
ncbi:MAG TPA: hypothetical protein VEV38_04260 [Candidatus Eremiobacteraceae bacterium]|nr:hypothetical protein [Candidatus Eremiobacteraceae bacterium]